MVRADGGGRSEGLDIVRWRRQLIYKRSIIEWRDSSNERLSNARSQLIRSCKVERHTNKPYRPDGHCSFPVIIDNRGKVNETADVVSGAATWRTKRNIRVVFDYGLFGPLYENVMSSTTPEVHNVLHCCQNTTKLQPYVTRTENLVKIGHVIFEICEWTDRNKQNSNRQTNTQTRRSQYFALLIIMTGSLWLPIDV